MVQSEEWSERVFTNLQLRAQVGPSQKYCPLSRESRPLRRAWRRLPRDRTEARSSDGVLLSCGTKIEKVKLPSAFLDLFILIKH